MLHPDGRVRCIVCSEPATYVHFRCDAHPVSADAEAYLKVRRALETLIRAIDGQVGDDTIEEMFEHISAMYDARAALAHTSGKPLCDKSDECYLPLGHTERCVSRSLLGNVP